MGSMGSLNLLVRLKAGQIAFAVFSICRVVFVPITVVLLSTFWVPSVCSDHAEGNLINFTDAHYFDPNNFLKETAKGIATRLKEIGDNELGINATQDFYNSQEYIVRSPDEAHQAQKLTERIEKKMTGFLTALKNSAMAVEHFARPVVSKPRFESACLLKARINDDQFVNLTIPPLTLNLTEVFETNRATSPTIKLQYLIPNADDNELTHVCTGERLGGCCITVDDPQFQNVYLKTLNNDAKQIVLMIDHGSSLSSNQLDAAKSLTKHIVYSLSHVDRIGVISLHENVTSPFNDSCKQNTMAYATENTKLRLVKFIDSLAKSKAATNHSLGFKVAFDLIDDVYRNEQEDVSIIYVSRGLLSSLHEKKAVLEVIARGQETVLPRVLINTCVLIDEAKPLVNYEPFLRDVALQNFRRHNISFDGKKSRYSLRGVMESISTVLNLGPAVRRLISSNYTTYGGKKEVLFFLPKWDRVDFVISISRKIELNTGLVGVVAIDIFLEDISEDVIYYNSKGNSYAFIIDTDGYTLMHPSLKQTGYYSEQPFIIDINQLEMVENFMDIRKKILTVSNGTHIVEQKTKENIKMVEYSWKKVYNAPYIVVVVTDLLEKPQGLLRFVQGAALGGFVHHRLDHFVSEQQSLCRYLSQLTSPNSGSLFLSAWCFQSPFKYLSSEKNVTPFNVQNYMAYLIDSTRLLANPGLKPGIRSDVISMVRVLQDWEKQFFTSKLRRYIIRKYIATGSGVLLMFPGSVVDHRLDPVRSFWFTRAAQNPGQLILSAPYLDTGGAGYIVTLSQALVYTRTNSSTVPSTVVMAMDLTLGYLYTILLDHMPFCSLQGVRNVAAEGKVKCFLMDDKGYLLAHPSVMDVNNKGLPTEGLHITHKAYPLVASDILNHKGLVEKLLCTDFSTGTLQRYYQFNTSLTDVVTNKISADQCVRYQMVAVPGTNIFVGVVNTTCVPTAFCPCSTLDRQCMNCNRMAQTDCECPCECPLNTDICYSEPHVVTKASPPCPHYAEPTMPMSVPTSVDALLAKVKPCFNYDCHQYINHRDCLGVIGCEWCEMKRDGLEPLASPFCTVQAYCFNGVLDAQVPYGERLIRTSSGSDGAASKRNSTSGPVPVGSAITTMVFALLLMCYCYRKRSRLNEHDFSYIRPVSLYALEKNQGKIIQEPPTDPHNGLLESAQEVSVALLTPVSPYLMSTGYCRPPAADSDHGYSTMTPQEDTDHNDLRPPEPMQQQTVMKPHRFLAPVTVHMVDT